MNSSVYKMIHKMEKEPKKGIPARPAKVNAAEDIIERVVGIPYDPKDLSNIPFIYFTSDPFLFQKSPALSTADDRSTRSVSHWTRQVVDEKKKRIFFFNEKTLNRKYQSVDN